MVNSISKLFAVIYKNIWHRDSYTWVCFFFLFCSSGLKYFSQERDMLNCYATIHSSTFTCLEHQISKRILLLVYDLYISKYF